MDRINRICTDSRFVRELEHIREDEKDRKFCRHGIEHLLDVARLMYIETLEAGEDTPRDLIYAAALLHDIGRHAQYTKGIPHETAGTDLAREILADCGYSPEETDIVCEAILGHRSSSDERTALGRRLYKADKMSRLCFACEARSECNWPEEKMNLEVGV